MLPGGILIEVCAKGAHLNRVVGGFYIGFDEIIALEQQARLIGLRTRIGVAIAHVEFRWVAPLAKSGIGVNRQGEFPLPDRHDLEIECLQKQPEAFARLMNLEAINMS